ncbi:C6 transcription factor [Colletotrichum truncatum]|uniref:C6 transcription factor n=1 Tax=Colletotrichum truncatum TaxID=5467 RepID=A0ACC3YC20_COLTU|nr:C6 transcription factor [Colletotrichum truncatum]KAF6793954.1 C6 transcription factor [Colletotrichum truncatum]
MYRIESILSPECPGHIQTVVATQAVQTKKPKEILTPPERIPVPRAGADPPHRLLPATSYDDEPRQLLPAAPKARRPSRAARPPMRSSIACLSCRKSKIKCDNNLRPPCDACAKAGQNCELPAFTPLPIKQPLLDVEAGHDRKRVKKIQNATPFYVTAKAEDVLSMPCLSESMWHQLFDIYKLHISTELPFLHIPTLKDVIHKKETEPPTADDNLILLGALALTVKFQPELVKYVTCQIHNNATRARSRGGYPKPNPSAASEYFANALTTALGPLELALTSASVVRVQAFLMLGLHKWSQPDGGLAAWVFVGVAIRMAQGLKLGIEATSQLSDFNKSYKGHSESWKAQEIKRRTMFSCLIMDCLLSCGAGRASMMRSDELQIQLPCEEPAFDLSRVVCTGFLQQPEPQIGRHIDNSVLSRFIQFVDLWGDIAKYSVAGGRLTETYPPWNKHSSFYQLNVRVEAIYSSLPEEFVLSSANYWKNNNSTYVLLHMLGAICRIVLHREYIPFLAINLEKPVGPLDETVAQSATVPGDFWYRSAEQVFMAGREVIDLIKICRHKLPQSPLAIFATWQAAFVGLYARHYPQMDAENHMIGEADIQERAAGLSSDFTRTGSTGIAFDALQKVAPCFGIASNYVRYSKNVDQYFTKVNSDYMQRCRRPRSEEALITRVNLTDSELGATRNKAMEILEAEGRRTSHNTPDDLTRTFSRSSSTGLKYSYLGANELDDGRRTSEASTLSSTIVSSQTSFCLGISSADVTSIESYVSEYQSKRLEAVLQDIHEFTGDVISSRMLELRA